MFTWRCRGSLGGRRPSTHQSAGCSEVLFRMSDSNLNRPSKSNRLAMPGKKDKIHTVNICTIKKKTFAYVSRRLFQIKVIHVRGNRPCTIGEWIERAW